MKYFEKGITCSRDAVLNEDTNKNQAAMKTWRKKGQS